MYVYKHQLHPNIFKDIFLDTDNTMGINQMQQKKSFKKSSGKNQRIKNTSDYNFHQLTNRNKVKFIELLKN